MNKNKNKITTADLTKVALGVAAIIAGGFMIFQWGVLIPFPGFKFMLMAPFLSMMIYILTSVIKHKHALLFVGGTFGFIMALINVFMGLAIITTTVLTYISIAPIGSNITKRKIGAVIFAAYTSLSALTISKIFIGGIFTELKFSWILGAAVICLLFGNIGLWLGTKVVKRLNMGYISS